ncbi:MAG TPA: NIPSNAP family protein [Candidatus Acidoferrales bacterium]|jgi:hypothetical protein|nr:NIPSNAP family protein [Candidatus Acidoferrales bacterium]
MDRRSFFQSLTAAGMLSQAPTPAAAQEAASAHPAGRKTRLYRMDYFYYRQGDQGTRINQFLASQMPLFTRHIHTLGVFNAVVTPLLQTTLVLSGFSSFEEMTGAGGAIEGDSGYQKAHEEFERGGEPPYDTAERQLLQATDFSPEIVPPAEKPKSPRYFELRIYHSPTQRQLRQVHERFAGAEIAIFHRSGVHPLFYADTIIGRELPNLTYLIPFAALADREKAWDAFGADPQWLKARADSIAKGGQIVNYNNLSLWKATGFSPIQ